MKECVFCGDFSERGGRLYSDSLVNILADRAPMVEGHLLIACADHRRSFSSFSESELDHIEEVILLAKARLRRYFSVSQVLVAEHGMAQQTKLRTCGIEHAHIHIVPSAVELDRSMLGPYLVNRLARLRELAAFKGDDYFLFSNQDDALMVFTGEYFPPQMFRALLATSLAVEEFDWQALKNDSIATNTTLKLRRVFESHE